MPNPALYKMAKKAKKSKAKAERYWREAKISATDRGFKEGDDEFYAYVMGIVKRRLGLSKATFHVKAHLLSESPVGWLSGLKHWS